MIDHDLSSADRLYNDADATEPSAAMPDSDTDGVIEQLWALRQEMLTSEQRRASAIAAVVPSYTAGARNLSHYLALRQRDHRALQDWLSWLGLSSLGRAESHVMANLDKVLGWLHRLSGKSWEPLSHDEPAGSRSSRKLLDRHTTLLLGTAPPERRVRMMVTLPDEAAVNYGLVRTLVNAGMDIARINCAHGDEALWRKMAANVRRAARAGGRPVKVFMDLAGPKLRTGHLPSGPSVLKIRPQRDDLGGVQAPALIGLRASGSNLPVAGAQVHIGVCPDWLALLAVGDRIECVDARAARRVFDVIQCDADSVLVECHKTCYLTPDTTLVLRRKKPRHASAVVTDLPAVEGSVLLRCGDVFRLVGREDGQLAGGGSGRAKKRGVVAEIPCTLPEVFLQVGAGERIWFDDGRIGGVIREAHPDYLTVEVTHARSCGEKLASDKGINLPDSQLNLPALTEKDIEDIPVVVELADLVGLSFAERPDDVRALLDLLKRDRGEMPGVVLKIETRRGFENLPELLLAVMRTPAAGLMIARGDLAVECGFERLAEIQEEILWAAEAAHMPVIWATQVLETQAKTGLPSRAEITDAAMGERAECVMLNKGPHITEAMRTLDDILRRMQSHQRKKRSLLRALKSWGGDARAEQAAPSAD
ncbi:MAG: pyruvate kinase [Rhodocyclaceae bacterium]|jgi:pyruvate kinase|nr:pyruvate kinase [Rhodocyclaceae bacterium]MBK6908363.1 pyruvate kinase [Rhodocyclaceae bacterium]